MNAIDLLSDRYNYLNYLLEEGYLHEEDYLNNIKPLDELLKILVSEEASKKNTLVHKVVNINGKEHSLIVPLGFDDKLLENLVRLINIGDT